MSLDTPVDTMASETDIPAKPRGSRRFRLWELNHKCHCPLVGTCFSLPEIRKLTSKLMNVPRHATDFEIHVTAVRESQQRSRLAELLQRELEQRYRLSIQQARKLTTTDALRAWWQQATQHGDVGAALWTVLTHPKCDDELTHQLYADVHMLQHQLGAGERVDRQQLQQFHHENAVLTRELAEIQKRFTLWRDQQTQTQHVLQHQLQAKELEIQQMQAQLAQRESELSALREQLPDLKQRQRLQRRAETAESLSTALRERVRQLESTLDNALQRLNDCEQLLATTLPAVQTTGGESTEPPPVTLSGHRVLCVGGRSGSSHLYRSLVEQQGGEFAYHDGGLEENINQLESCVAAADAVICQTGCISHNAYWRVKEHCKRTGKACIFVKTPSVSAFLRGLQRLGAPELQEAISEGDHE